MSCIKTCFNVLPVIFGILLFAWSYYTYVVVLCIFTGISLVKQIIYLIVYHALFLITFLSYVATICIENDEIPEAYKLPVFEYESLKMAESDDEKNVILERFCRFRRIKVYTTTSAGNIRFCKKCKHVKPDRAHHCSVCKRCIPKMDHHCPWVNNCIGFSNYKTFVVLLFYATLYCLFIAATTLEYFIYFWSSTGMRDINIQQVVALFAVACCVDVLVASLFGYHMSLVLENSTTLENLREPLFRDPGLTFDLGCSSNFVEAFGDNCFCWFCPCDTSEGDGLEFPLHAEV